MGVTVTFVAILELMREGLIDIVQTEAYAPLHVRARRRQPYTPPRRRRGSRASSRGSEQPRMQDA